MFSATESTLVIGHRGGAGAAPENTVEAIRHGIEAGTDAIEFDIHATRDGQIVVIHDDTVERTTDGAGVVEEMNLDELRQLDAGFNFTPDFGRSFPFRGTGIRIPTLDEAVEACEGLPIACEVKTARAGLLLADWLPGKAVRERMIVGGFEADDVRPAASAARWRCANQRDLTPFVLLGKLGIPARLAADITAAMVPLRKGLVRVVTAGFVRRCHEAGIGVHVWTVNAPDKMRQLLELGVDGLISDYPAIARRIIEEHRAHGTEGAPVLEPAQE